MPDTVRFVNDADVPQTLEEKRFVDETAPLTSAAIMPFVEETLEAFTFAKFAVPLTLIFEDVTPPKNETGTEVVAPRAVIAAKVSVE